MFCCDASVETLQKKTANQALIHQLICYSEQGRSIEKQTGPATVKIGNAEEAPGRVWEGGTPPSQQGGMGERWKLPHRGLGLRPRSQCFLTQKTTCVSHVNTIAVSLLISHHT